MHLVALYGLDMMEIAPPTVQVHGSSLVEEEFGSYIMTTSQPDIDALVFWEVSDPIVH